MTWPLHLLLFISLGVCDGNYDLNVGDPGSWLPLSL